MNGKTTASNRTAGSCFNLLPAVGLMMLLSVLPVFGQKAQRASPRPIFHVSWAPDWTLEPRRVLKPTVPELLISRFRLGNLTIVLERTPLQRAQRLVGGLVGQSGDAAESVGWLCVTGRDRGGPWALWLNTWEVEGATVSGFNWERIPAGAIVDRRCARLRRPTTLITSPFRFPLGDSKARILHRLGRASWRTSHSLVYAHPRDLVLHRLPYTEYETVAFGFRHGKVVRLEVDKTTQD